MIVKCSPHPRTIPVFKSRNDIDENDDDGACGDVIDYIETDADVCVLIIGGYNLVG